MVNFVMAYHKMLSLSILLFILITLSIPATCNATSLRAVHHQSQLDQQKVPFMNYDQEDCPPWFYSDEGTCKCLVLHFYAARCFDNKAYLSAGFCATFDTSTDSDSDILSLGECPSYQGRRCRSGWSGFGRTTFWQDNLFIEPAYS